MQQFLLFAAIGLGSGAVFAILATGLIITFKGTGVINFAAGAMGLWSGYVYSELQQKGDYVFPVVLVPDRVHVGDLSTAGSLSVAVLTGLAIGLVVHLAVFRPLRHAPVLAKVVASAGVMLALQALIVMRFGSGALQVDPILPNQPVSIGSVGVPRDRLWLAAVAVIIAIATSLWFRTSRTGLAIRAGAENERFASLAGYSPDVLAGAAWALASGLIGLMIVLASPLTGLNPVSDTLIVVPALACALVGKLRYIGPAVVAGLGLGIVQSELTLYATKSWWPNWANVGLASAVPFVAVIVVLFLIGDSLPTRDAEATTRLPSPSRPRNRPGVIAGLVVAAVFAVVLTGGSYRFGIITSMAVAVIALSFVVLTGLMGQVSFAQAAFAGLAAFALSKLTQQADLGFPLAPLLAAGAASLLGMVVAVPALRIRGAQLAVVTLAMSLAVEQLLFRNPSFNDIQSGNLVTQPHLLGVNLSVRGGSQTARLQFAILVLVVLALSALAVANWMRSATGRRLLAIRSNERASASLGLDVTRTKLLGFGFSAFLAGLGGALLAYSHGSVSADSFTTLVGVSFLVFAYLGGIASISGAIVAGLFAPLGIVFVIANRKIPGASTEAYQLVSAVGLIVTAIINPTGLAGGTRKKWDDIRARMKPQRSGAPKATAVREPASVTVGPPPVAVRRRGATANDGLLQTSALSVHFGGVRALDGVTLEVRPGQIVGLLGANGAGKTTFIDAVSGFVPYQGRVRLAGRDLDRLPPHARARAGLARTWQSIELFSDLTVRDNLQVAAEWSTALSSGRDFVQPGRRDGAQRVDAALRLLRLEAVADQLPGALSLGDQKLVNVARSLAADPVVLLLDEPAAGLATEDTKALGEVLRSMVTAHVGALLIEHDVGLVLGICDYVYVLDFGRLIASGRPDHVRSDPAVLRAYLGIENTVAEETVERSHPTGAVSVVPTRPLP